MTNESAQIAPEEDVEDLDEVNEVIPTAYTITAYGADYPVDGLVKRLGQGDIVVPLFSMQADAGQTTVGFQREFVWTKPQCDRFIESLLLGLPVRLHVVSCGKQHCHWGIAGANGLAGRCLSLDMRR